MTIPSQTNAQSLAALISSFGASTGQQPVLSAGDVLLAIFEAFATQEDFLQGLIQLVNNLTRAQTSSGSDLDSWYGQFNFSRLPATSAEGPVTLAALSPAINPVYVPAATLTNGVYVGGTTVQTQDGSIVYQLIPDTTQAAYNATLNAYVLAAGQTSITASAQCTVAGASGNVTVGQLSQLGTSIPGIATVTNAAAISNGANAESDSSYRSRFVLWFNSLADATATAITAAANDVQQGLQLSLVENELPNGTSQLGSFTMFVDNGSGSPPSQLLTDVFNAVNAVRAFSVQANVAGPTIISATIALTIRVASGYTASTVEAAVQAAIVAAVNALAFGATLYISAVETAALSVAGVTAVKSGTTINASTNDLTCTSSQEIRTTTGSVSVGTY